MIYLFAKCLQYKAFTIFIYIHLHAGISFCHECTNLLHVYYDFKKNSYICDIKTTINELYIKQINK